MDSTPFFTRDGDCYQPTTVSRGPWDPKSLHGRVVIGLLGAVIEQRHGAPEYMPARLTVDMYRLPDLDPIEVITRAIRDGYRIKVIEAELFSAGVSMARASCQLLRRGEPPAGKVWSPPNWSAPPPDALQTGDPAMALGGMWKILPIVGAMGDVGPRRLWMAEVRDLVGGEPLTPFVRVALASDFASPYANAGDKILNYINSDVTLYLHRTPMSEWVGFEVVNHQATDGIAVGECWLYDEIGAIGTATVAALARDAMRLST
jgi:hypothetical protein